jgi:hypothetical protein
VEGEYYSSLDDLVRDQFGWIIGGGLADQSLSALDLPIEWEISREEFERIWQEAIRQREQRQ